MVCFGQQESTLLELLGKSHVMHVSYDRCWWYDELKLLKGTHVCRSNTHPDMKSHVIERLATDHHGI